MDYYETDTLAELMRLKADCLEKLRQLGGLQLALIEQGDVDQLFRVLSAKQTLLEDLQGQEAALAPFRSQEPEKRRWRSPQDRSSCARKAAECESLLAEILRQEQDSEKILCRRKDETAAQLTVAHAAGQVRGAYQEMNQPRSHFDLSMEG